MEVQGVKELLHRDYGPAPRVVAVLPRLLLEGVDGVLDAVELSPTLF